MSDESEQTDSYYPGGLQCIRYRTTSVANLLQKHRKKVNTSNKWRRLQLYKEPVSKGGGRMIECLWTKWGRATGDNRDICLLTELEGRTETYLARSQDALASLPSVQRSAEFAPNIFLPGHPTQSINT